MPPAHGPDASARFAPGVRRAASRKLEHELGIPTSKTPPEQFTYLTKIHYLAPSDGLWGEHEGQSLTLLRFSNRMIITTDAVWPLAVDYILFTTLDTEHTDNPNEVMDSCYVTKQELQIMFDDPGESPTRRLRRLLRC